VSYMSVRGFHIADPPTPLVAVVFPTRDEYVAYAAEQGTTLSDNTVGHYSQQSNRMFLYDMLEGRSGDDWAINAETIIHEATHQTAYNVGIHNRFAEQPKWVVEGLASMFEAPGVWSSSSRRTLADRINAYRLGHFRQRTADRSDQWIAALAASDRPFETATLDAYAEAWMLSFYLCETRPQEYSAYLARVAQRPLFSRYTPGERLADFTAAFGHDFKMLQTQVQHFAGKLP
ncbi:MAG TPA: DUF1570 domain-containing protein, partial [Lacipirellulaceae bacterium]|nr:DUF1570 domain-containing protein [Lacipirellulaceae bacterium]